MGQLISVGQQAVLATAQQLRPKYSRVAKKTQLLTQFLIR